MSQEMPPTDSKTKIRPQQSCVRCRERKVKCDRSRPCHACIIRGIEADCTYLATDEDYAQISQAEIIERLRREVAQLRGQLSQGPRQSPNPASWRRHEYARKYGMDGAKLAGSGSGKGSASASASASASGSNSGSRSGNNRMVQSTSVLHGKGNAMEQESWAGSSPTSSTTTMTNSNSLNMTSPDSTGSENGSTMLSYPTTAPYGTSIVEAEGAGAFGEMSYPTSEVTVAYCQPEMPTFGEIPASAPLTQGVPTQPIMHPDATHFQEISSMQPNGPYGDAQAYLLSRGYYEKPDSPLHAYPWGHDAMGSQFAAPYSDSSYISSSINALDANTSASATASATAYAPTHPHPHPHPHPLSQPPTNSQFQIPPVPPTNHHHLDPLQREWTPSPVDSVPDSWKTEGKQELLETLLDTISSCDEKSVAQVVAVVRASATPEAAVSGICKVLGISGMEHNDLHPI